MRLIDADALARHLTDIWYTQLPTDNDTGAKRAEKQARADSIIDMTVVVENAPTITAPIKRAKWNAVHDYSYGDRTVYECSECGNITPTAYPYCPYCGARMDSKGV